MKKTIVPIIALLTLPVFAFAQTSTTKPIEVPRGWHTLDPSKDGFAGISLDQAYELVKGKKSKTVVVAVIDSGIDTLHEDLKDVLWRNAKEIAGNGIDDDKNGYIDDVYGWNFLGNKDGRNVEKDSYEGARLYHKLKSKYGKTSLDTLQLSAAEKQEYSLYKKVAATIEPQAKQAQGQLLFLRSAYKNMAKSDSILQKAIGKKEFTPKEIESMTFNDEAVKRAKNGFISFMRGNDMMETTNTSFMSDFTSYLEGEEAKAAMLETAPVPYRANIVQDNYYDPKDRFYGNGDVMGKTARHGTHVAGIIGASRNNEKGMNGIADNVKIMMLRAVPDGDEHDKDIANAIRYAVNNGAQVINMSFGKSFSPEKSWVDEAVAYAESKGVLLVHAAGNDAKNVDIEDNFPNASSLKGKKFTNWITVGASADPSEGSYAASFSNYGAREVDVFAPGTKIYATVPGGNTYENLQGTSMASPVVAGLAALILSYYPDLSAAQVKQAIEKTVTQPTTKVKKPGADESVDFSALCRTGGIINAKGALAYAGTLKGERAKTPANAPKSKQTINSPKKKG